MAIIMFVPIVAICVTWANQINVKSLILKIKVKVRKAKKGNCAIQLQMFESKMMDFFPNINYWATYVYTKDNTPIHRERWAVAIINA